MQTARLKLTSSDYTQLEGICGRIQEVATRTGAKHSGTIAMPTKKMVIPTRKSMCGGGTESYEKWQMRIHKRMIDIQADETTLRRIMRVEIPENVHVEIELKDKK
ncbi:MAG: 30S ribosomal protein S10 [Candidatus Diapherotrites archaeon CG11_big_fil_rev_8_21_14_0_20_37_9]|nr:MAG: 30S ribosomal protein S10 [Candidatus Diapherotrites archaeon CG11_big_fil_rev_8_21_14_0_20_37_9]